jgi:hypothetical protein
MPGKTHRLSLFAIVLVLIFLGAQLHFCADLTSGSSSSHICPICSAAGSVVVPASPGISPGLSLDRLEFFAVIVLFSIELPHAVSPRAPPVL